MYLDKLIDEFQNLSSSVHKLKEVVNFGKYPNGKEVPAVEMELLQKQLKAMKTYEEVLIKRIELSMEEMAKGE